MTAPTPVPTTAPTPSGTTEGAREFSALLDTAESCYVQVIRALKPRSVEIADANYRAARAAVEAEYSAKVKECQTTARDLSDAWEHIRELRATIATLEAQLVEGKRLVGEGLEAVEQLIRERNFQWAKCEDVSYVLTKVTEERDSARARLTALTEENRVMLAALADEYPGSTWADKLAALGSSGSGASHAD